MPKTRQRWSASKRKLRLTIHKGVDVDTTNYQRRPARTGLSLFYLTALLLVTFLCYSLVAATSSDSLAAHRYPSKQAAIKQARTVHSSAAALGAAVHSATATRHSLAPAPATHPVMGVKQKATARTVMPIRRSHIAVAHSIATLGGVGVAPVSPNPLAKQALAVAGTGQANELVQLIQTYFPRRAWQQAVVVAWCESRFHNSSINYDQNGTHDRGYFQLNDGGTEQMLLQMTGQNQHNVDLAFNPVWNVRAAAVLYKRDGWSQWSCRYSL